jgi:8-oxo-dGTP pyrophosphatase MutT (NUDIX family)
VSEELTHAGAVAFRKRGERVEFLVVTSSNGQHWVLPKGHIDPGESPQQTALRELAEEAGVGGEILSPLAVKTFHVPGETARVQYFLVRATETRPAEEERTLAWLGAEEAVTRLSFDDARETVRLAVAALS